jgi:hypothetical protein
MGEYDSLESFNLKNHGDRRERLWGQVIQTEFPAYEVLWRRYIVPLTNRINPAILDTSEWIRLRPEVKRLEWMTMCHYSVFYYLARARARMLDDTLPLFPEDVFTLLDTCRDNVGHFFESVRKIFGDFGRPAPRLPTQEPLLCSREDRVKPELERGGFVMAKAYRDVMIHNPVLGRTIDKTAEALPHWTVLERVKCSWRAAESLKPGDWISCHDLFEALYLDITRFLQDEWQSIIDAMENLRNNPQHAAKFKSYWALEALMPITAPSITLRLDSPAVSGIQVSSNTAIYSPTAVMPRILKKHEK